MVNFASAAKRSARAVAALFLPPVFRTRRAVLLAADLADFLVDLALVFMVLSLQWLTQPCARTGCGMHRRAHLDGLCAASLIVDGCRASLAENTCHCKA